MALVPEEEAIRTFGNIISLVRLNEEYAKTYFKQGNTEAASAALKMAIERLQVLRDKLKPPRAPVDRSASNMVSVITKAPL